MRCSGVQNFCKKTFLSVLFCLFSLNCTGGNKELQFDIRDPENLHMEVAHIRTHIKANIEDVQFHYNLDSCDLGVSGGCLLNLRVSGKLKGKTEIWVEIRKANEEIIARGYQIVSAIEKTTSTIITLTRGCSSDAACDDGESCNGTEKCENTICVLGSKIADGGECDTGDYCQIDGQCILGVCTGTLRTCNEPKNTEDAPCFEEEGSCSDGACVYALREDLQCGDGIVCGAETCDEGGSLDPCDDCDDNCQLFVKIYDLIIPVNHWKPGNR